MQPASATDKPLPTRIKLLNWGTNASTEGDVIVDERTLETFAAMQRKIGRERAPLDWEHNTVPGTPEYERTHEPRPIAGMGTPVVIRGDGLYLENLTYTATGQASARDYEDVSAAPLLNAERVVVGLHSAGLTRTGAVYGATFTQLSAAAQGDLLKLAGDGITLAAFSARLPFSAPSAPSSVLRPPSSETPSVQPTHNPVTNMPEPVTIESLAAQVTALATKLEGRLAAIEAKPAAPAVDLTPLSARLDKIEAAHTAAAAAATEAEKAKVITLFASAGKAPVNPATGKPYTADELKALDLPTLQVLSANTPATVPLSARNHTVTAGEGKSDLKGLARVAAAINAQLNVK
jgi:hypothetical protein